MGAKILLVEDDPLVVVATAKMLEKYDFSVLTSHSGTEAIEIVEGNREISLVLMDIFLGKGMDGIDAAGSILSMRDLPIIFLSNSSNQAELERAKEISNYGYILKNSGEFILVESITMALDHFRERKNQEEIRHQMQYHADLLQQVHEAIIATDTELKILSWNSAAGDIYGWTEDEAKGRELDALLGSEFLSMSQLEAQRVLGKQGLWRGELRQYRKDGATVYVEATVSTVRDRQGKMVGGVTVNRDITARRMMEEYLRYERDLNRRIMDTSPAGIMLIDTAGNTRYMNNQARELLGFGGESNLSRPSDPGREITDFEGNPILEEELPCSMVLSSGIPVYDCTHIVTRPDGKRVYLSVNAAPLLDGNGECSGVVSIFSDVGREYRLRRQIQLQRDTLVRINSLSDIEEVFEAVLEYAATIDGVDCAAMFLHDDEQRAMKLIAQRGMESEWLERLGLVADDDSPVDLFNEGGKAFFARYSELFRETRYDGLTDRLRACGVVPLFQEGRAIGVLCFGSYDRDAFSDSGKAIMESMGQWVGDIVQKRWSVEQVLKINRELEQQKQELQEVNTTLKVLLQNMEQEQSRQVEALRGQLRNLVMPLMDSLDRIASGERVSQLLHVLRSNLQIALTDGKGDRGLPLDTLTPKELQVAFLLKDRRSSKDVAEILGVSVHSVFFHRKNIRRKLGIKNGKVNLVTLLRG